MCRAARNRTGAASTPRMYTTAILQPVQNYFVLADALMHLAQALTLFPEGNMAH